MSSRTASRPPASRPEVRDRLRAIGSDPVPVPALVTTGPWPPLATVAEVDLSGGDLSGGDAADAGDMTPRWVPGPPPTAGPVVDRTRDGHVPTGDDQVPTEDGHVPTGDDQVPTEDGRARPVTAQSALAAAATAYTAAYGHPLSHEDLGGGPDAEHRRRWSITPRVALVASGGLVLLLGAVLVVALRSTPGAPTTLDLGVETATGSDRPGRSEDSTDTSASAAPTDGPGPAATSTVGAASGDGSASSDPAGVVVHVVGQVVSPGVVTLRAGARVADAVEAAGGATAEADLSAVNLARVAVDGEQIVVPRPGEQALAAAGGSGSGTAGAGTGAAGPVDLNTATLADLDALPGIGPVLAQRILDWRTANGDFATVDDLGEVTGIGDTLLERLRPDVRV